MICAIFPGTSEPLRSTAWAADRNSRTKTKTKIKTKTKTKIKSKTRIKIRTRTTTARTENEGRGCPSPAGLRRGERWGTRVQGCRQCHLRTIPNQADAHPDDGPGEVRGEGGASGRDQAVGPGDLRKPGRFERRRRGFNRFHSPGRRQGLEAVRAGARRKRRQCPGLHGRQGRRCKAAGGDSPARRNHGDRGKSQSGSDAEVDDLAWLDG